MKQTMLEVARGLREVEAVTFTTIMISSESELVHKMAKAGQAYAKACRSAGKGHKLGVPQPYIFEELIAELSDSAGDDEEDEILKIMVDLDEMSFCNDGGDKKSNLDWNSEVAAQYPNDSDFGRVFAMEEVKEGSELLCNYSGFFEKDKWKFFGL